MPTMSCDGDGESTRVKFLRTDPLPLVSVRVNGGDEVTFFIDTGGSEVALDTEFARELDVPQFGAVQGTFSGGQHAEVHQGRIDSLTLGDWTVRNLPVAILPLRQLSQGLGAKQIDGVIGTTFFYHFLATLDFPNGELVLRRKDATSLAQFMASADNNVAVPFWIAGDHFMVGWGRVEALAPSLLFVDTGLDGAGVKLAETVIKPSKPASSSRRTKPPLARAAAGRCESCPISCIACRLERCRKPTFPGSMTDHFPGKAALALRSRAWSATISSSLTQLPSISRT